VAVNSNPIRFGVFEVRRDARELRKHGVRIKLEDQPFELLTALLEKPGDIVTRSELQARLWPEGTFVDFDKSLTKAVNKIRTALGDSPVAPRFIETLSGRGYRFIAPLDVVADLVPPLGLAEATPARTERPRGASLQGWWIVAAASCAVVAIAAVLLALNVGSLHDRLRAALDLKRAVIPPGIDSIAVLPLENLSRDPEQEYFADGLTDDLITDLGKMITLRVISRTSVMQYKRTKKPLPEIARELNVDAAVEGTVQRSGRRVRVTAQLLQARTDRHLWAETYERDSADVIQLERQMAVAIAHEVTGRLSAAQETRFARGGRPIHGHTTLTCAAVTFGVKELRNSPRRQSDTSSRRCGKIRISRSLIPASPIAMRWPGGQRGRETCPWRRNTPGRRWRSSRNWPSHTHRSESSMPTGTDTPMPRRS
jgi:TolB-like protein/DNA-binding winged helix-turn-helix (wHTH) protein